MSGFWSIATPRSGAPAADTTSATWGARLASACSPRRNLASLIERPAGAFRPADGLRALSVLWVIAYHTLPPLAHGLTPSARAAFYASPVVEMLHEGHLGVDVFFVISGFLITHLLMRELDRRGGVSFGRFYARRALRLLPAYYVALALYCLTGGANRAMLWANLVYVNNVFEPRCMSWSWSLAVEEHFYLAFPPLLAWLYRRGRVAPLAFCLAAAAALAVRAVAASAHGITLPLPPLDAPGGAERYRIYFEQFDTKTYTRYGSIVFGVLVAYALHRTRLASRLAARPLPVALALVAAFALAAFTVWAGVDGHQLADASPIVRAAYLTAHRSLFSAAVAVVLFATVADLSPARPLTRFLSSRVWLPFAHLSYSAYLLHLIVWEYLEDKFAPHAPPSAAYLGAVLAMSAAAAFAAALVMYLSVERPFMNLRAR